MTARSLVRLLPSGPGVYRFRDGRGRALYLGRAGNLRRRVGSYWGDLRDRPHLRSMVARIVGIEAVCCDSEHEAAWLERNLLERSKPRWNRMRGGLEVPVCIRLDRGGLAVVHEPTARPGVRYFGPYLGGQRVRAAVNALGRVLPLAYASDRLLGSERELARIRGVDPGHRDVLELRIVAVLSGEPEAVADVLAELTRRREAAAAALAFELAAVIHDEIEAVRWVCAEQKVTRLEPVDEDAYGWCDGVLVRFEVRGGRLLAWSQLGSGESGARAKVAATPSRWSEFALRNAALAARLCP